VEDVEFVDAEEDVSDDDIPSFTAGDATKEKESN